MSLVIRSPLARAGLMAGSLAAVLAAGITSTRSFLALAVLMLLPVATSLGPAGRLAVSLQDLKRRAIRVAAWGVPICASNAAVLHVASVGAVGAGLLIHLMDVEESKMLLKIAQPRSWSVEGSRVVIEHAAYVQWAGKRLARAEGVPAVVIDPASPDVP